VRAVILLERRLVVVRERQVDGVHISLPGGRVRHGEDVLDALVREVQEETGLDVRPGRLLYVAEVNSGRALHDVNLVFRAIPHTETVEGLDLELVDIEDRAADLVMPPVIDELRLDVLSDWSRTPSWLGNVWDAAAGREVPPT
jgi:8-oxo-dGTP diphosphatase